MESLWCLKMNSIILYLIRHGKTKCNEERRYCGSTNVSLSELGRKELKERRDKLKYPTCKLNFTSGAKRANETFELIYPDVNYKENKDFWEYNFGDFELKTYDMLKQDQRYIDWICDKSSEVACPNGESRKEFYTRLKNAFISFLGDLKLNGENEALVVCHGGTIGTLLELFYDGGKDFYSYQPKCGGGYKLKINIDEEVKMEILEEF